MWGVHRRLHVGILSSDLLRDHPVGNMMRNVLALMDLSRMQVTVFLIHEQQWQAATSADSKHLIGDVSFVMLGRATHASQQSDPKLAEDGASVVNTRGVGILVDLIGYTADHRQDVLALRPAPVQLLYHGYMATSGAEYIDYYMADAVIAPPEHAHFFTEKLVLMPECFLGPSHRLVHQLWGWSGGSKNDWDGRGEDDVMVRRDAVGLPPSGPVICNFNQHFKIDPETFATWRAAIAHLSATPATAGRRSAASATAREANATLWLLRGTAVSERNLEREFAAAGGGGNLIWAERVPVKDHLRRAPLCHLAHLALPKP
jgi:predicted O-linked N-acetylglucosamine transferase (SPINDLY family)